MSSSSNPRAAALAAAEARLRSTSSPSSTPTVTTSITNDTTTPSLSQSSSVTLKDTIISPVERPQISPQSSSLNPNCSTATTTTSSTSPSSPSSSFINRISSGSGLGSGLAQLNHPSSLATSRAMDLTDTRQDETRRKEIRKQIYRSIVRDGGYVKAALCVETLLKIATNIQSSSDPKYRDIKADNLALKDKVLCVPGAHEFLITMGFRVETREFVKHYILQQTARRTHELNLASEVLREVLPDLQSRATTKTISTISHKADEARRVAAALREIDEDRLAVKARAERERIGREAMAKQLKEAEEVAEAAAAAAAAAAAVQAATGGSGSDFGSGAEFEVGTENLMDDDHSMRRGRPFASRDHAQGEEGEGGGHHEEDEEEESEVDPDERRKRFDDDVNYSRKWGVGQRLGD